MRTSKAPAFFGPLFLSITLAASVITAPALRAQAPAAGTTVAVKMIDTVESGSDSAGKQYRASVTKAVTASNEIAIPQGAAATVTLTSSGSGYTVQLSSITINGQQVAVTSDSATVSAAAQNAQARAASAVGSVLGGLGHHVSAPATVVAAAAGAHVSLPTGTTLTFVLAASPAQTQTAANAAAPHPVSGSPAMAAPGPSQAGASETTAFYCLTPLTAQNVIYYSPIELRGPATTQPEIEGAFGAFLQKTYGIRVSITCTQINTSSQYEVDRQQKINDYRTSYKVVETSWVYSPTAAAAPVPPVTASTVASAGGPFIICATSGGPGMDTYLTAAFQTTRVNRSPSGGNQVDQSILDDFYAYLKQKGYNFKPGSNYGCAVKPTEAEAKADEQKRQSGCSNCGKIVETGWKE
jgi:hypothetical protein